MRNKRLYLEGESPEELMPMQRFWDGTAEVYSDARLTTEGEGELELILSRSGNAEKMVCLGAATGCRDPLAFLDSGKAKPQKILVNDLSPELLGICYQNLLQYPGMDVLALEGAVHTSLGKCKDKLLHFLGDIEPLFALGIYREEIFYDKFNSHSALELYSEEKENIGSDCSVYPLFYDSCMRVDRHAGINFGLPILPAELEVIEERLESYENSRHFSGFQFNSRKGGNPFVSHYYTKDCLYRLLCGVFPKEEYAVEIVDTKSRCYTAFIGRRRRKQNTLITMINNVLGNIPLDLHVLSLAAVRDVFYG